MNNIDRIRTILNVIFMIGALVSVILYFTQTDDKTLFFYVCGGSIFIKMIEYMLRFLLR